MITNNEDLQRMKKGCEGCGLTCLPLQRTCENKFLCRRCME